MKAHTLAMKIVKLLIESGLSIEDQLKVIKSVQKRLEFCKVKGQEIKNKQLTIF
jgi:intergrase/recombinase